MRAEAAGARRVIVGRRARRRQDHPKIVASDRVGRDPTRQRAPSSRARVDNLVGYFNRWPLIERGALRHLHARPAAPRRSRRRPETPGSVRASCRRPRPRAVTIARRRRKKRRRRIGFTVPHQPRWATTPTRTRTRTPTPTTPPTPTPPARRKIPTRSWTRWPSFARTRRPPSNTSARAARRDFACTSGRPRATTTTSPSRRRRPPSRRRRRRPRRRRRRRRANVRARRTPTPPATGRLSSTFLSPSAPSARIAPSITRLSPAATPSAAFA